MRRARVQPNGFGLIEILIAIGIFAIAAMAILALNMQLIKGNTQAVAPVQVDAFRRSLIALTLNDSAWALTVKNNPGMSCLLPTAAAPCKNQNFQTFAIYDAGNHLVYNPRGPNNGLTLVAGPCSFSPGQPSDQCPVWFNLSWAPVCPPSGPCLRPSQVMVKAPLTYSPAHQTVILNPQNYSVPTIYRSAD